MRRLAPFALLAALLAGGCDVGASHKNHGRLTPHTLEAVRSRGYVRCGASKEAPGFSGPDESGRWRGLDVDTCRAIAVAALGDREKVRFVPLTGQQRITALQTGEIDVLPRTTTWTLRRDAAGINFTIPTYYDYTAFMVRRKVGVHDLAGLRGASACVQSGSMTEVILADVSRKYRLALRPVIFDNVQSTRQAFLSGRCDALITDASALAALRATLPGRADDYVILPADSNVAPLTPAVRHGDDQWFDIVKFSIEAMIDGEQLGIGRDNADRLRASADPNVRRFLGVEPGNGRALGISDDFAYQIVRQIGNYGEVYDDNLGSRSRLNIPRGLNRLQRDGGLMLPIGFY